MSKSYPIRDAAEPNNHEIYKVYINRLGLKMHHLGDLTKRGLSGEHIQKAQYATKPRNNVSAAAQALGHLVGTFGSQLDEVPGFYIDDKGNRAQSGSSGLVIPSRDTAGNISSLLIRSDNQNIDERGRHTNKYVAFSSNGKEKGGKVSQKTHCPIVRGTAKDISGSTVRITEGILKADIATALDDIYCLGMHGLNIQSDLASILVDLEISEVRIALDAGEDENEDMLQAKVKLIRLIQEIGLEFKIELWDTQYGKGIDDVLAGAHKDKIRYATPEEVSKLLAGGQENKPIIMIRGGGLSSQATQGEAALIAAGLPIYQRSAKLVTPITQMTDASGGRQAKIAVLHEISRARMTDHLCDTAFWMKKTEEGEVIVINPPANVADTILNRYGVWSFPALAGVVMTPTLRPDGSLLKDIGYDPATRLYLLDAPPMPELPEAPSRNDALEALKILEDLLVDFPFVDEASRSVALSILITPIVRGACRVVPMHVVRAPTPGTGKSFLLDTASAIATGQPCPVMAAGRNEEETEKRLGAALLTGQSIIAIDNHNGDLGGDALCQMIERPTVSMRILGKSEQVIIESRSTIFANGNNVKLTGDITRRAVQCLLDANCERPELRSFRMNPYKVVLEDRGKYIAAILIIARAYISAGKPDIITPRLASFEEWSDLVRSALVWLGKADPLASMEAARSEDPTLQAMSEVFTAIWDVRGDKIFTAKQIVELASEQTADSTWSASYEHAALRDALINAAADNRGFLLPKRVGQWLGRHKGRICNNLRLESKVDDHGHPAQWWLVKSGSAVESG